MVGALSASCLGRGEVHEQGANELLGAQLSGVLQGLVIEPQCTNR